MLQQHSTKINVPTATQMQLNNWACLSLEFETVGVQDTKCQNIHQNEIEFHFEMKL